MRRVRERFEKVLRDLKGDLERCQDFRVARIMIRMFSSDLR